MKQPKYYMQTDLKWATKPYTSCGDRTQTIASSGCGLLSTKMMLEEYGIILSPEELAKLSIDNGFRTKADGTSWGFYTWIAKKYGLVCEQTLDFNKFIESLKGGKLVICSMGRKSAAERGFFTSSGHFILAWGIDNKGIYANDPISKYRTNIPVNPEVWKNECHQYFIFSKIISNNNIKVEDKPVNFEESLNFLNNKISINVKYWTEKKGIDPYFDDLIIKIANGWKAGK